ncbi:hypothetical protein [Streptococcus pneumoniae]|uniref:hypothetical protein n=1 Tax=Streptococcus pneumoniae TaxID=1313 RepID=UPI00067E19C3|nr:hypothetical protein [Streptococcus pneumoniae]
MKSKEQTRKLAVGCSKYSFEVADKTVTKSAQNTVLRLWIELTKSVTICSKHCFEVVDRTDEVSNYIYGKAKLTWFEEIFEEY